LLLDSPGPGEVLIRVRAAGLCHSDLSVIDGNRPRPLPMALGHEAAGEVVELGAGVTSFAPGDHVVSSFVPSCGACKPCSSGRPALCEPALAANSAGTLLSGARRLRLKNGEIVNHHLGVSAFAEYAVVSERSLVKIDQDLPFDRAAVFGCAVITGVGAVINTANVSRGASVAVIGLGGVGLAALIGAKRLNAAPLVAVDLSEEKLATARAMGATHTFNASSADCAEQIRAATEGGVEFAFEMAGSTRAMELAYKITCRGGTTVTAGLPHPQALMTLPQVTLVAEERTIKGSYLGSCVPARDIPAYIGWHRAGELPVERLLSEHVQLDDINAAFDRLAAGKTIRQVIVF
jgi:Zn-dependent alcohol dehydrogenase